MLAASRTGERLSVDWQTRLGRRLFSSDLAVIMVTLVGSAFAIHDSAWGATVLGLDEPIVVPFSVTALVLVSAWMLELSLHETRDPRIVGVGVEEYKRVVNAAIRLFGVIAIAALLLKIDVARSYLLLAFPLGVLALLCSRWLWRQWLISKRERGEYSSRVLVVGSPASVAVACDELRSYAPNGFFVVGTWVTGGRDESGPTTGGFTTFFSNEVTVMDALDQIDADTVVIVDARALGDQGISELSWQLEPGRHQVILAPETANVGGPRLNTRPVVGLPFIHVETPRYQGATRASKRAFDIIVASALTLVLSPLLLVLALLVRSGSPGPILFRQERVGLRGAPFTMLKFRTMVVDAEDQLPSLLDERSAGNAVMFKMKNDPRVTAVGRLLRRFSLDELPQLFNVLSGSMSLVGPRPPLPAEVELYEAHVHRRFLVKPGITGLWQVSGRSNLSWEESVRLDLTYVQNWSLVGDIHILWRTLRAVFRREGAY